MARKWSLFFTTVDTFLKKGILTLFLLGIFLSAGIVPGLSQANNPVVANDPIELVKQGKEYYEAGQFQQALSSLQQAVDALAASKERLNLSIALSNLSLVYQQLGEWERARQSVEQSLEFLGVDPKIVGTSQVPEDLPAPNLKIIPQVLNIYGYLWYRRSRSEMALHSWRLAADISQQSNQPEGAIVARINQVQALQAMGLDREAKITIERLQQSLDLMPASIATQGWRSLGDTLRIVGELDGSVRSLEKSLQIAKKSNSPQNIAATWLSLGNSFRALGNLERDRQDLVREYDSIPWRCDNFSLADRALNFYRQADTAYQNAIASSVPTFVSTKAKINHLSLLVETGQLSAARNSWRQIDLTDLPSSRGQIYAEINLARTLTCLARQLDSTSNDLPSWQEIDDILVDAARDAETLADPLARSYALGNRGGFYEYLAWREGGDRQKLAIAQSFTETALLLAQPKVAPSIAYQWQWQLGRLLAAKGDRIDAIFAYQAAVKTLDAVRNDLLAINSEVQFSFRDNVEPVYRQLVDLLLESESTSSPSQENLAMAIDSIDSLQIAELENFLRCNLSPLTSNQQQAAPEKEAFVYPIILDDKLEVLFKLPGQPLKHHASYRNRADVLKTVRELRQAILRRNPEKFRENSRQVYQWLIEPLEKDLERSPDLETLVFVLDSELRNIPMGVLYDARANEYLIEKKYDLSVLPNSRLFQLRPSSGDLKVLAAGITEPIEVENRQFEAISAREELAQIKNTFFSQTLLNSQFTKANIKEQINSGDYSVVHLATHGNFSSDPKETYIVTYDELLGPNELNDLLNDRDRARANNLELLVLSACETASGDNRAALGLAGFAVRTGTNSTLATLWKVSDKFTIKLMNKFYEELSRQSTKARALHLAQKALIYERRGDREYQNDPYDWGPYILVGNWY